MGVHIQKVTCENGDLVQTVNIMAGRNTPPDNVLMVHQGNSLIDGSETLDVTGKMFGNDTAVTANVLAQVTLAASTVHRNDLSSAAKGFWQLIFTVDALTAGEEVDIAIITW
jgi:hypothetical protein